MEALIAVIFSTDFVTPIAGGGIFAAIVGVMGYTIHLNIATQQRSDRLAQSDHDSLLEENTRLRAEKEALIEERDAWRDRYLTLIGAK